MYEYYLSNIIERSNLENIYDHYDIIIEYHNVKHVLHDIDMNIKLKDLLSSNIQVNLNNNIISIKKLIERVEHSFYIKGSMLIDDNFRKKALIYTYDEDFNLVTVKDKLFQLIVDKFDTDYGKKLTFIDRL